MSATESFFKRLRHAGIKAGDSEDLKLKKSILVFAMGLMTAISSNSHSGEPLAGAPGAGSLHPAEEGVGSRLKNACWVYPIPLAVGAVVVPLILDASSSLLGSGATRIPLLCHAP